MQVPNDGHTHHENTFMLCPKAKLQVSEIEKRGKIEGRRGACWQKVTFTLDFSFWHEDG